MEFKFSKDSGDSQQMEASGEKKKQSALLVILLILIGGFTYVYFFTGLIKPQDAVITAEAPVASAPQIVKIPLPPREGEPAKPESKNPENPESQKIAASAPVSAVAPPKKSVAAPVPAVKTAPPPVQPKEKGAPQKADAAKPADKKPQPAAVVNQKTEKTESTKTVAKKLGPVVQAKPKSVAKTVKSSPDSWMLVVGNYVLEETLSSDMGRVRKAGFEPIVKPASRKKAAMNRLFVSDFNDRASAQSSLDKLKRLTSDAFVIEQGGKFTVYAGSYLQTEAANSEKERLKGAGFAVTIKHTDIAIPSQSLSIGPFKSKKSADTALGKLKSAGIKATLSQK